MDTQPLTRVRLTDLKGYPGNARRGDIEAIKDSLQVNGQFQPLIVQRSTSFVLSGNHTWEAMRQLGWEEADAYYVDADDDHARRIVLAANRTADLGGYDERALLTLLREVGEDLTGTGFDADDFDDLLAAIQEADADHPADDTDPGGAPTGTAGAYGPGSDGTNVRQTPTYAEYQEQYSSRATRFMALNYPLPQYAWIVERLSTIADEEGVDNFAEAVLRLVEARTSETAPPLEEGQVIGGPTTAMGLLPDAEEAPADA